MKKFFESVLLSLLLGVSVLLGLSFWLNIKFGFNLFYAKHWVLLSELQATHTPISITFYFSIIVAIFVFISGLYMIFRPRFRNIFKHKTKQEKTEYVPQKPQIPVETNNKKEEEKTISTPQINISRPHRLNLPKNINEIAATKYSQQNTTSTIPQKDSTEHNGVLAEIFTNNNYVVKKNPVISGFTPNLFAIGANEVLWIGAIDCDINKIKDSITKLSGIFSDTLSDIEIHIKSFIIDSFKRYDSDDTVKIFHNMEDLKQFISENQGDEVTKEEKENFDAYSEYIDTIISYVKNI